jgi:hypothetical protein
MTASATPENYTTLTDVTDGLSDGRLPPLFPHTYVGASLRAGPRTVAISLHHDALTRFLRAHLFLNAVEWRFWAR